MKKFLLLSLAALALPVSAQTKRIAIIKADDVREVDPKWDRFFKLAEEHGVPVSAGVIGNSFEKQDEKYDEWLKKWEATGKVEYWHHGWDHRRWDEEGKHKSEFNGTGFAQQRDHLVKTQDAAKAALGKPFVAFGSPFNEVDADTAKALNEIPELKMFFCWPQAEPAKELKGKTLLLMTMPGENDGTGKPNFAKFKEVYQRRMADPSFAFCALQFHPGAFAEEGFGEFASIIEFLKAEGWTFMLPGEYAKSLEK
ncbi:DUF2334 domain-containing protein [Luteolibacter soli]|uniref:Polysaccharide deacetylase family protein n=1 Tax=Luteolibacter soli TaxID=3135280 RepID=A0ABU9AQK7_9BACT